MTQLLDLHEEHPIAFEAELIRAGLRWRDFPTAGFTWRDLLVIVATSDPSGPLGLARAPQNAVTPDTMLLRSVEHSLRWLVWAKSADARSGRPPQPWLFEWEQGEDHGYRTDDLTVEEVNEFLGWADLVREENERRAQTGRPLIPTS